MKRIRHRPFKRQSVSRVIRDTHAVVTVSGNNDDFEKMEKVIREAARIYNYHSDNKMSYEIRLINRLNDHEGKNLIC